MTPLLFLATVLIWGTTFHAITLQLGEVPALQSVFYRFALAALVMWLYAMVRRNRPAHGRGVHGLFALLGLLLFSLNYVVVYYATDYLISGLVSVIFSLLILFNTLFYWIFFRQRPTPALVAAGILGVSGIGALFIDDLYGVSMSESVALGAGLTLLSLLMASAGNMLVQALKQRGVDVISCNTWGMSYGTLFLFLTVIVTGEPWRFSTRPEYVWSLLYLSLAGTVVAFWTYLTLIHRIGAPRAAYISVLFPLVALLVSTLYEGLQWTVYKLLGVVLILAGNLFIIRRRRGPGTPAADTARA